MTVKSGINWVRSTSRSVLHEAHCTKLWHWTFGKKTLWSLWKVISGSKDPSINGKRLRALQASDFKLVTFGSAGNALSTFDLTSITVKSCLEFPLHSLHAVYGFLHYSFCLSQLELSFTILHRPTTSFRLEFICSVEEFLLGLYYADLICVYSYLILDVCVFSAGQGGASGSDGVADHPGDSQQTRSHVGPRADGHVGRALSHCSQQPSCPKR